MGRQHHPKGGFPLLSFTFFCFLFLLLFQVPGRGYTSPCGLHNRISTTEEGPISNTLLAFLKKKRFRWHVFWCLTFCHLFSFFFYIVSFIDVCLHGCVVFHCFPFFICSRKVFRGMNVFCPYLLLHFIKPKHTFRCTPSPQRTFKHVWNVSLYIYKNIYFFSFFVCSSFEFSRSLIFLNPKPHVFIEISLLPPSLPPWPRLFDRNGPSSRFTKSNSTPDLNCSFQFINVFQFLQTCKFIV